MHVNRMEKKMTNKAQLEAVDIDIALARIASG
jgi:hypothetical protein